MKTILVATDFSEASFNAAAYAVNMALIIDSKIMLLHIIQIPMMYGEVPVTFSIEDINKTAVQKIKEFKERLLMTANQALHINTQINVGIFIHELKTVCEDIQPDFVVVGNQGRTAAERALFGSHTIQAIKTLVWPVISVPADVSFSSVKKIGLASDFRKILDTTPVNEIKILVNEFKAELHILNIGNKSSYDPDTIFESGILQELFYELKPIYHIINADNTDNSILDFAEKNKIDLLIVVPKRYNLVDAMMHKSHTKQIVLHGHVAIFSLHH